MLQQEYAVVFGGGGYSNTTSAWPAVQQLTTYTSTTTKYFGYLSNGTTDYNMQCQFYIDVSTPLPANAVISSIYLWLDLVHNSSTNTMYARVMRDYWGAPSGWSTADQETASTLDNYNPWAWSTLSSGWTSGLKLFVPYTDMETYYKSVVGTSTEMEFTLTSHHLVTYNSADPGVYSSYGSVSPSSTNHKLQVNYYVPQQNRVILGCNI